MQFISVAPVSVIPHFQNRKVGTELIKDDLDRARKLGFESVIVLGHSRQYPLDSKKPANTGFQPPFDVPDNAFFAIELEQDSLKNCSGTIKYPREFDDVQPQKRTLSIS